MYVIPFPLVHTHFRDEVLYLEQKTSLQNQPKYEDR